MKSHSKLACLFGCSHVPYSMCYILPIFVARQHKKTGQSPVTAHFRWSPWQQIKIYSLFFYLYLYMLMQSVYNQLGKVIFQSLQLLPWKQSLKNQVSKKNLVYFADLLTSKVNIK